MIIKRKKNIVFSIFTCVALVISTFCNFITSESVTAVGNGKTYLKYTYSTKSLTKYELPELPILTNDGILNSRASTDNRPNSSLEKVLVKIINGGAAGTGFIIGDHEIMTAAHVVTNLNVDKPSIIIPKSNPYSNNYVSLTAISTTFPEDAYVELDGNDYAIITVKEDLTSYGSVFLGLGVHESKLVKNNVYALGYKGNAQKISSGKIEEINEKNYQTSAYTYPGTSGGPVYCQYKFGVQGSTDPDEKVQTYKTVIGISSMIWGKELENGEYICSSSIATRITPEILQFAYNNDFL